MAVDKAEAVSNAHVAAQKGIGAQTLLEILGPLAAERKERLLDVLASAPPRLEVLLDVRARLVELHRITKELDRVKREGADAALALRKIMEE